MLINQYLSKTAKWLPEKVALIYDNKQFHYKDIDLASDNLANSLINMGVQKQDRIVIFAGNTPETVIAVFGVMKAGCIFVVVDNNLKAGKLNYILKDTGASTIIVDIKKARIVQEALNGVVIKNIIWCTDDTSNKADILTEVIKVTNTYKWNECIENKHSKIPIRLPAVIDVDLCALFYTSGTTGVPKGIMTAHYNAEAVMKSLASIFENSEKDIVLDALPLSFDYGLYQVFICFMVGATVVLERSFLYAYRIAKLLESNKVTAFPIVPTMAALMFKLEDIDKFDFSCIRYVTSSTAALPISYIPKIKKLFPNAAIFSRYGLSESVTATYLPPSMLEQKIGSVGIPLPNTDAFIVDAQGNPVGPGTEGELVIRGAIVMQGYWRAPERTAKVFRNGAYRSDVLLYTGDLFKQDDDGYLYFISRKDDLVKIGGERVSPKEVENILVNCEGVIEAAVIPIPDEILGNSLKAFVVKEKRFSLTKQTILNHCIKNMEPYMVPKMVEIRDELPKTENGKVDKKMLSKE